MTHVKRMLISADPQEVRVAIVEGGKLSEAYIERRGRRSIVGNIYKGRVDAVLPGMEAAFVDIGLPKNGFLYVAEIVLPELDDRERRSKRIQELIQSGQDVLVQVTKDPMGSKGARLTMDVSLAGRFMVLAPGGDGVGVSKKLEGPERDRLRDLLAQDEDAGGRRPDRAHRRAGRLPGRARARRAAAREALVREPRPRPARRGARARLRRAGSLAADGARRLPQRRGRARDRRRAPVPPHPRLRAAHLARSSPSASSSTRASARSSSATRSSRASAPRSPAACRCPPAARSCSTTARRSRSSTSTRGASRARPRSSRTRSSRTTSRPRSRSSASCACATSAASSSSTSSTWRARRTATPCSRCCSASSRRTAARSTSSRSRRSASSR